MSVINNTESSNGEALDLRLLWNVIGQGKVIIVLAMTLFAILFIGIALFLNNTYKSNVILMPQEQNESALSGVPSQLKSLAGLAGASLGSSQSNQAILGIEIIKSRKFLSYFVNKHDILIPLFASDGWDQSTNTLIFDPDIYDIKTKSWTRPFTPPQKLIPSSGEIKKEFLKLLSIIPDEDTGMITVSLETHSPTISQQWLNWLIDDINTVIREKDVNQATKAIEYLTEKLEKTQINEIRSIFFKLIETEHRKILMAETKRDYVFETLDSAVSADEKASPRRAIIVIAGTLLGGFLSLIMLLIRYSFRNRRV